MARNFEGHVQKKRCSLYLGIFFLTLSDIPQCISYLPWVTQMKICLKSHFFFFGNFPLTCIQKRSSSRCILQRCDKFDLPRNF